MKSYSRDQAEALANELLWDIRYHQRCIKDLEDALCRLSRDSHITIPLPTP